MYTHANHHVVLQTVVRLLDHSPAAALRRFCSDARLPRGGNHQGIEPGAQDQQHADQRRPARDLAKK